MNKEEFKEKFEKNVAYLHKVIPPDDIYVFAEQTFMSALFFLSKWAEWVDLQEEAEADPVVKKWAKNILGMQMCKDMEIPIEVDLDLKSIENNEY